MDRGASPLAGPSEVHPAGARRQLYSALETVLLTADRRDRLDTSIVELAADPAWSPMVSRLCCLRGVSTLTAFGLTVEVGD